MKELRWNLIKSEHLKRTRGASFKEITGDGKVVDIMSHPGRVRQKIILYLYREYIWVVPCVEQEGFYFLKTFYPSRKLTKLYRQGGLT